MSAIERQREDLPYLLGHILERWNGLGKLTNRHNAHAYLMDRLTAEHHKSNRDPVTPQNLKNCISKLLDRWDLNGNISIKRDGDASIMRELSDELTKLQENAQ
ncbi:hypothetical protein [Thalassospira lucentensis]|uniref:hypothetical protein n=1 Tax=Thalassospira lucentensis TaxID=168935 RepID=UPI003D291F45